MFLGHTIPPPMDQPPVAPEPAPVPPAVYTHSPPPKILTRSVTMNDKPAITSTASLLEALVALRNPVRALQSQAFFKTAPGEYGEGNQFLGIPVPTLRQLSRTHRAMSTRSVIALLQSPWHEARQLALFILVLQFERGDEVKREDVYTRYVQHTLYINNWDLVDCSARQIVGGWLLDRDRAPIETLVRSRVLWERRIGVLALFRLVEEGECEYPLQIARLLLSDPHDLMHKAVGWMLRDIGDGDRATLERFLDAHVAKMPRTMLRYAIEHFPEQQRRHYLAR